MFYCEGQTGSGLLGAAQIKECLQPRGAVLSSVSVVSGYRCCCCCWLFWNTTSFYSYGFKLNLDVEKWVNCTRNMVRLYFLLVFIVPAAPRDFLVIALSCLSPKLLFVNQERVQRVSAFFSLTE